MRKYLIFAVIVFACICNAKATNVGTFCYSLNNDTQTAVFSGLISGVSLDSVIIPATITYDANTYTITSIGDEALKGKTNIVYIHMPNTIISIGTRAFSGCTKLSEISIPNSVTNIANDAFSSCTSLPIIDNIRYADTYLVGVTDKKLATYTIKAGTKWLGASAFSGCTSLTDITLPSTIVMIGSYAFKSCTKLTTISIPSSVQQVGAEAFAGCTLLNSVIFPNSITSVGGGIFKNCKNLTTPIFNTHCFVYLPSSYNGEYSIPEGIEIVDGGAFYNCNSLESITIPTSVVKIKGCVFEDCANLSSVTWNAVNATIPDNFWGISCNQKITSFTIGDKVEVIPAYLCYYLCGITSISIPKSVRTIGTRAFNNCSNLKSIYLSEGVEEIGFYAFAGCSSVSQISIPNTVTLIRESAFSSCTSLKSITIPESVDSIGYYLFSYCSVLDSVTWNAKKCKFKTGGSTDTAPFKNCASITSFVFGENVEQIPSNLCFNLSHITSIIIPQSVKYISSGAFHNCSSLDTVICKSPTPPNTVDAITNYYYNMPFPYQLQNKGCLRVPCGAKSAYQESILGLYFKNIEDESTYTIKVQSNNETMGYTISDLNCNTNEATIIAIANDGYRFVQWSDGAMEASREFILTQDTSLVAQFEIFPEYNVYFLDWNGVLLNEQLVKDGESATVPSAPTREGYIFTGWSGNIKNVSERVFAIAQYEKEQIGAIPVHFVDKDGETLLESYVFDAAPIAPIVTGQTFIGWQTVVADIQNGIVVRATYENSEPTSVPSANEEIDAPTKILRDSQVLILRGDKTYTLTGQEVK